MPWVITDWDKHYENSRSRGMKRLDWVPMPNHHDGGDYAKIAEHERGAEIFTAFVLCVEVASKMPVRGILADSNGHELTFRDLARKTRFPAAMFEFALPWLADKTKWIINTDVNPPTAPCQDADGQPSGSRRDPVTERREENRREEKESSGKPEDPKAEQCPPKKITPVQSLIGFFTDGLKKIDTEMSANGGHLARIFHDRLKSTSEAEIRRRIENWFKSDDGFVRENLNNAGVFNQKFHLLKSPIMLGRNKGGINAGTRTSGAAAPVKGKYANVSE